MAFSSLSKKMEKLAGRVPGLRTYLARENLRDSDKLIRDELVAKADVVKGVLDQAKTDRMDAGNLKHLDKLDRATRKIEKVRDTIRFDSRGYRGLFDPEEVTEKDLIALIEFDEKLFGVIDELEGSARSVAALPDAELVGALKNFEGQVEALAQTLSEREKYSTEKLPTKK